MVDAALHICTRYRSPCDLETAPSDAPPLMPSSARFLVELLRGRGDVLPVSALPFDAPIRAAPRSSRSGIWPTRFPSGRPARASSAASAPGSPACAIRIRPTTRRCSPPLRHLQGHALSRPRVRGMQYTIQVAPEDCTGCRLCVEVCPARDRQTRSSAVMQPQRALREPERENYRFFLGLPEWTGDAETHSVKGRSSWSAVRVLRRLRRLRRDAVPEAHDRIFGDRMLVAMPRAAPSIFGANCRPPLRPIRQDGVPPGRTRSSRTTPSSPRMRLRVESRAQSPAPGRTPA